MELIKPENFEPCKKSLGKALVLERTCGDNECHIPAGFKIFADLLDKLCLKARFLAASIPAIWRITETKAEYSIRHANPFQEIRIQREIKGLPVFLEDLSVDLDPEGRDLSCFSQSLSERLKRTPIPETRFQNRDFFIRAGEKTAQPPGVHGVCVVCPKDRLVSKRSVKHRYLIHTYPP